MNDKMMLHSAARNEMSALYALAYNETARAVGDATIDIDEAWDWYGSATWEAEFGASWPDSEGPVTVEAALEAVRNDLSYWTEE